MQAEVGRGVVPFLRNHPLGCQPKDVEPSIPYQTIMLRSSYRDSRIKEGRVFDRITIEALGAVFKHGGCGERSARFWRLTIIFLHRYGPFQVLIDVSILDV